MTAAALTLDELLIDAIARGVDAGDLDAIGRHVGDLRRIAHETAAAIAAARIETDRRLRLLERIADLVQRHEPTAAERLDP